MLIRTSLLRLLPLLLLLPTAQAEVFQQQNGIKVGYEHLLDAKDNNPNLYSQSYLSFTNTTRASWGDFAAWLTLENPLDDNDNQQGNKAGATVKSWLKLDYNLGDTPLIFGYSLLRPTIKTVPKKTSTMACLTTSNGRSSKGPWR
ncbi:hypothetical protein ACWAU3_05190 [Shewanella sp. JL219SE-S6]